MELRGGTQRVTQEQFAEHVGVSVDFLSLIERGIHAASFETTEQMANRLQMPAKALFDFAAASPAK
jgi:transcriptional regulator with XRE-family HTH domain